MNVESHHILLMVAVIALAALGAASVVTGHDSIELIIASIVGLAGGAPPVLALFQKNPPAA